MEKRNIVLIHKKDDKQCLRNYWPVSLVPVCGKILEKLISDKMFQFFINNKLIATNQSGFQPIDSCINQLLSITHNIYKSFDEGFEVSGVFHDTSKAFDMVLHEGIIFKLKKSSISRNLLEILAEFLKYKKQKVVLNGQVSNWADVTTRVPYGFILGPLLSLIYVNDLATSFSSIARLFADETSLFSVAHDVNTSANELNSELAKINNWAFQWKMNFNADPSRQA